MQFSTKILPSGFCPKFKGWRLLPFWKILDPPLISKRNEALSGKALSHWTSTKLNFTQNLFDTIEEDVPCRIPFYVNELKRQIDPISPWGHTAVLPARSRDVPRSTSGLVKYFLSVSERIIKYNFLPLYTGLTCDVLSPLGSVHTELLAIVFSVSDAKMGRMPILGNIRYRSVLSVNRTLQDVLPPCTWTDLWYVLPLT